MRREQRASSRLLRRWRTNLIRLRLETFMLITQVKHRKNSRRLTVPVFAALAVGFASAHLQAQVSLTTVVELAQKNSSAVKLADADLQKAQAALGQTEDAY